MPSESIGRCEQHRPDRSSLIHAVKTPEMAPLAMRPIIRDWRLAAAFFTKGINPAPFRGRVEEIIRLMGRPDYPPVTIFTRWPACNCWPAARLLSTRNQSALLSVTAIFCASESTVSPGCTVMT